MSRDHVLPSHDCAHTVDPRLQTVDENRAVAAAANVILAAPDDLDRPLMLCSLHHYGGFGSHVAGRCCTTSKAAAREQRLDRNLAGLQPQDRRSCFLVHGLKLRADGSIPSVRLMTQSFGSMGA